MSDEVERIFLARRTVRRFQPRGVERAVIERLMALATTAPSASNKQPWRFIVVRDRAVIAAMAAAVRARREVLLAEMDPAGREAFAAYGAYFTRFEEAPCVIAPTFRATAILSHLLGPSIDPAAREEVLAMERASAQVSAALAVENLLLAAPSLGLGASALTGPLVAARAIAGLLKLPASWELLALLALGYPDEEPRASERKPVEQVLRWVGGED